MVESFSVSKNTSCGGEKWNLTVFVIVSRAIGILLNNELLLLFVSMH